MKTLDYIRENMNIKVVKLFGVSGILAPVVGFTMIFLAIRTAPWFSWTGNALSDLGVEGLTAAVFNGGLVMTAAVMMTFSLSINEVTKGDIVGQAGFVLSLAVAGFLMGIGVFPETAGAIHYYLSVAFFASLPLCTLVLAAYMARNNMKKLSIISAVAGVISALVWIPHWSAVAIPEALSSLAFGVWSTVFGVWMITRKEERKILGKDSPYVPGEGYGVSDVI